MSSRRFAGYVPLAIVVALVAVPASIATAVDLVDTFDLDTITTLDLVGGVLGQSSLAMAMVCAVILGRQMATAQWRPTRDTEGTLGPTDGPA